MALWMWLLHPSVSFLAIISRAACSSLVAVVLLPRLTLAHGLNVGLHSVYGCPVTLDVMALMAHSQGKWKPRKSDQKQNS